MSNNDYEFIKSFTSFAMSKCKNLEDGQDLIHDVVLSILRNPSTFDNIIDPREKKNYIMRAIKNKYKDTIKRSGASKRDNIGWVNLKEFNTPYVYSLLDLKFILEKSKKDKELKSLILKNEGYNTNEIAFLMHKKQNAVLAQIFRAKKRLKNENFF